MRATGSGGRLRHGVTNYPMAGGKNSNLQGGIRTRAAVSGGVLPVSLRGQTSDAWMHLVDVRHATPCSTRTTILRALVLANEPSSNHLCVLVAD